MSELKSAVSMKKILLRDVRLTWLAKVSMLLAMSYVPVSKQSKEEVALRWTRVQLALQPEG